MAIKLLVAEFNINTINNLPKSAKIDVTSVIYQIKISAFQNYVGPSCLAVKCYILPGTYSRIIVDFIFY